MLSPLSITAWCLVVDAGQEVEVLEWNLLWLNAELVLKLATSSVLDTRDSVWQVVTTFSGDAEWVRTAGVGPHIRKSDLLSSALLEEQLVVLVEQEDGECAMKESLVNVGHKMA